MLTPAQVKAQVAAIKKSTSNGARVFAIHAPAAWSGPASLDVSGEEHKVLLCRSDLQVREALLQAEGDQAPYILLCSFDPMRLGDDVLARLAKRRVFHPRASEVLAELFGARIIDPRVLACKPLVEALTTAAPQDGYRPVAGGSLDLQTAWLSLGEALFGSRWDAPSLTGILAWSLDERKLSILQKLSPDLREAMTEWLVRSRGEAARFILTAAECGAGPELVPLGLLMGLLFQAQCRGLPETQAALGRLERYFKNREIDEASAKTWAATAEELIRERALTDPASLRSLLAGLDRMIEQVRVSGLAQFSDFSPRGLESRFEAAGLALAKALESKTSVSLEPARAALKQVQAHFLASENGARIERVGMALRLVTWFKTAELLPPEASLSQLSEYYLKEGGFVDWARDNLTVSDPVSSLRDAYHDILRRVDQRFGPFEQAFVTTLQLWCRNGSPPTAMLPIEDVMAEVVCPAAREHPVLLLVLDGMSVAAFRQLLDDVVQRDWVELAHEKTGVPRVVAAALPSVTEVSRWALLAGRIAEDRRSTEKIEFARNQRLLEVVGSQSKPHLFLKADLANEGQLGLASNVQATLLNTRNRVVAVVVNAMDDLLAAGDQVAVSWGIDSIKPLRELLYAARDSRRIVLMTSDHGHVLDRNSSQARTEVAETGDRFREPGGALNEGELEFKGRRVEQAMGPAGVICLVKQGLRYQARKRGYHGGACVQEVVVPLAALRHVGNPVPENWQDLPPFQPAWWQIKQATREIPVPPVRPMPKPAPPKPAMELDLFAQASSGPGVSEAGSDWIAALSSSELYRAQLRRAARLPKLKDELPKLLRLLDDRGGSMLRAALAQELRLPLFRIDGLVQNAARILNVDGYEVIVFERVAETVVLNSSLLKSQFGIS